MNVTFIDGIESMSGTMNCGNGRRMTIYHRKGDKPGQGHARMWSKGDHPRTTPVSEKELANRELFVRTNEKYSQLTEQEKNWFARKFQDCHGVFKGKKYATVHGFTKARLYDEQKKSQIGIS